MRKGVKLEDDVEESPGNPGNPRSPGSPGNKKRIPIFNSVIVFSYIFYFYYVI